MLNEKEIVNRLQQGDPNAFKEVYEFYIHKLHRFICTFISDSDQAKDIVQITFIKIWEKKSTIDLTKSFKAFVFTIAYRNVIDQVRKKESMGIMAKSDIHSFDDCFVSSETAENLINQHDLDSVYTRALETLSPKKKEIFILSRHEGLSNKEIATKMGISVKTVEYHMTEILAGLKDYFVKSKIGAIIIFFLLT